MLKFVNLQKKYPAGDEALKGVPMMVSSGEIVALIGPSGAGKSTLIRCVNRLVKPSRGQIFLGDVEITGLRQRQLRAIRRKIGMIFQEFALVERLTVMENVLSGKLGYMSVGRSLLRRYPADYAQEALDILERVGLETQSEKRADALSGGQRQRVGIARALMRTPTFYLSTSLPPVWTRKRHVPF